MEISCTGACMSLAPLSLLPSLLWLLFFVSQDKHKEKASNLAMIFIWGIFSAIPVVVAQDALRFVALPLLASVAIAPVLWHFLGVAFIEEIAKYLVVKTKAVSKKFFDEPKDAIIYMITAALGFAAIENLIYSLTFAGSPQEVMGLIFYRGVTSTLLHAVASGALGYFLALSLVNKGERRKFLYTGIIVATLLHGIYNHFIMNLEGQIQRLGDAGGLFGLSTISILLVFSGIILLIGLNKLTKLKFTQSAGHANSGEYQPKQAEK